MDKLLTQARRGIPQGSACSPIVGAFCMAHLSGHWPLETALLNFADNFLLSWRPKRVTSGRVHREANSCCRGAPWRAFSTENRPARPCQCGLRLSWTSHAFKGLPSSYVDQPRKSGGDDRCIEEAQKNAPAREMPPLGPARKTMKCLERVCAHLKGWENALFRGCDDISGVGDRLTLHDPAKNAGPQGKEGTAHLRQLAEILNMPSGNIRRMFSPHKSCEDIKRIESLQRGRMPSSRVETHKCRV